MNPNSHGGVEDLPCIRGNNERNHGRSELHANVMQKIGKGAVCQGFELLLNRDAGTQDHPWVKKNVNVRDECLAEFSGYNVSRGDQEFLQVDDKNGNSGILSLIPFGFRMPRVGSYIEAE